jgi:hypothetical protein
MNRLAMYAATALAMLLTTTAHAAPLILLNLTNGGSGSYSLSFTVTSNHISLSVGGYNVPDFTFVNNGFLSNASSPATNLLNPTWNYTPAPSGAGAGQGGGELIFGGTTQGSYDIFDQIVPAGAGDRLTYSFDVSGAGPASGLFVGVAGATLGPGAPSPVVGGGALSALAAAAALLLTRRKPTAA